ncbi:MAG: crossover junction endodeoxyribonuclease RuvC [Bacteroidetes bacterium]|nr:crossover junction endodeoxyribonuclease RuvC [Bacteroidota bacterium]
MKILGIDPGSVFCGYGVIDANGKKLSVIEYGTIEVKKKAEYLPLRMKEIYDRILSVIDRTAPDSAAIESVFYSKNVQSLIKLSMARSAAILAVVNRNIDIAEYTAKDIKRSVTGRGNANKEQVRYMMKAILNIAETSNYYDTTDALAIAVCHSNHIVLEGKNSFSSSNNKSTKKTSWAKYLENHPDKIVKL